MPKTDKVQVKVTLTIRPGLVTPHMRDCWRRWWASRIAEVKRSEDGSSNVK